MVICGSYMFEFSVSKDMKQKYNNDYKEISNISFSIMSKNNCWRIGN